MSWIVGISGASGAPYALRLLQAFKGREMHVVATNAGRRVFLEEIGKTIEEAAEEFKHHQIENIGASIASGSFPIKGMVVIPCSMRTLGAIANGIGDNLLTRAADVTLKEGRPLILVPRETPLNLIHLENMLKVVRAGARVVPAMPGFYHQPLTIEDLVNQLVGKVMDQMGEPNQLFPRWQG